MPREIRNQYHVSYVYSNCGTHTNFFWAKLVSFTWNSQIVSGFQSSLFYDFYDLQIELRLPTILADLSWAMKANSNCIPRTLRTSQTIQEWSSITTTMTSMTSMNIFFIELTAVKDHHVRHHCRSPSDAQCAQFQAEFATWRRSAGTRLMTSHGANHKWGDMEAHKYVDECVEACTWRGLRDTNTKNKGTTCFCTLRFVGNEDHCFGVIAL